MIIKTTANNKRIEYIRYTKSEADNLQSFCFYEKLDINNLINLSIEWIPELKKVFYNLKVKKG